MRFCTLALCTAGILSAGLAYAADSNSGLAFDPITGFSVDAGAKIYNRQVLFPEVPSYEAVAAKVSDLIQKQRQEAAVARGPRLLHPEARGHASAL